MKKQEACVLSGHFSGFLKLVEGLSSDEISNLMNETHLIIENTIRLHQGKINQFTGEKLLAVFKNSGLNASILVHAVDAAAELKGHLKDYSENKKLSGDFGLKTGLAFGEVVSAEFGSGDSKQSTIMGEAITHAHRICEFAGMDQILVGGNIYGATEGSFEYQSLEPIPLKGGTEVLPIFELTGKKRKKLDIKSKSERKIVSAMVGRSREAEQLEGLINKLVAGKGSIVNIVGKAGIGKSRLMAEMKVQPIMEKVLLLEGRALSTGQNLSFHPITNLIKSWAGITEDDIPSVSSEKLHQGIKHNTSEQADEIYAFIATMMGLPLEGKYKERVKGIEGEALEKLILKNLRDLIIAATKDKPRIYMIEDMHWADGSSITLFESLYKLSQKYPVMFINVMRPGYKKTGDYILKYLVDNFPGDHTTIHVNPLEEKESGNLIKNLLRETPIPDEIQKMIIRKTEGNPFFIEEIIRNFIDEGIIEVKDGKFIVTDKIKDVDIPETINEAILSRVDKLDEKTRELLNTASVMGRNFYYKVLEEATDTIEELDDRLAYLSEVQLISESKKKQEIEYLFKHALAQQLTYDSIIQQSRIDLHNKIAHSIEKVFAQNLNEYYGTLVYHYKMAENEEKTIHYLLLAGEEAMQSGASSEALQFFEHAIDVLPESRKNDSKDFEIRDLRIKIAKMYHALGQNKEALSLFEYVFGYYFNFRFAKTERGIMIKGLRAMLTLVFVFKYESLYFKKPLKKDDETFFETIREWAYALSTVNPKHFVFKSTFGGVKFRNYNITESIDGLAMFSDLAGVLVWAGFSHSTSRKILDFAQKNGIENNPHSLISFYMTKAMLDYNTGNWYKNESFDKIFYTGLNVGEIWLTTLFTLYYCYQQLEMGDISILDVAKEKFGEMADSFENSHARSNKYRFGSFGLLKFRKFEQLQEFLDEGVALLEESDNNAHLFVLYLVQAQLHIINNKINEAKEFLVKAGKNLEENRMIPVLYTHYLITKNQLELEMIKVQHTNGENYKKMMKTFLNTSNILISKSQKLVGNLTEAYLLRSGIFQFQQKFKKAFKNLQLAIQTGEKYNGRLELSRAYFETGKFLSDPKVKYNELNGNPASYYLEKAKTMFEEMDLQWDMEEYTKFMEN